MGLLFLLSQPYYDPISGLGLALVLNHLFRVLRLEFVEYVSYPFHLFNSLLGKLQIFLSLCFQMFFLFYRLFLIRRQGFRFLF